LYAVPAAHGSFPTLSLRIFPWMLDPVPRRYTVCSRLFLPRCHRPSPSKEWVGFPHVVPRITTSRRSVFRGCRYSLMFRPPSLLSPQIVPTAALTAAGQPGILRPGLSCFVTSTRTGYANRLTQAIDGTGTFTLSDSQPCRLLTLLRRHYPTSLLVRPCPTPAMTVACRDVEAATLATSGSPPITRTTFPTCRAPYPGGSRGCLCRLLPHGCSLPQMAGGSASALSLSRPARASLTLRPVGSLNRPRRPLSRGSSPSGYPAEPLVSFRINRQLSGWHLPPLVIRALGAHGHERT
jgi:hypothetical protein